MGRTRRQRLGQHFLRNDQVALDILSALRLTGSERVLEIGPGKGFLTRIVAPHCRELVAVEYDSNLATILEATVPTNVRVVSADVLEFDYRSGGPFDVVVGNLPYSISSAITFRVLGWLAEGGWKRAVLMYQKEFAHRMAAAPGTPDYGRLTVGVYRRAECRLVRRVKRGCFQPPPRVESAIVELVPRPAPPFAVADEDFYDAAVAALFSQRRKTIRRTLSNKAHELGIPKERVEPVLASLDFTNERAEDLSPERLADLANALAPHRLPASGKGKSRPREEE